MKVYLIAGIIIIVLSVVVFLLIKKLYNLNRKFKKTEKENSQQEKIIEAEKKQQQIVKDAEDKYEKEVNEVKKRSGRSKFDAINERLRKH